MINNRQNGNGRRGRGRGGNGAGGGGLRPMSGGGQGGNRIDNRARGNAAQLHEKYKTLARDAQMQGDRVMTEYYHQFADHYFRVLAETRGRFEEQQQRQRRDDPSDDYDGDEGDDQGGESGDRYEERPRFERQERQDRGERQERPERRPVEARGERRPREDGARDARPRDEYRQRDDARPRNDRVRDDRARDERTQDERVRDDRGEERPAEVRGHGGDAANAEPVTNPIAPVETSVSPAVEAEPVRRPRGRPRRERIDAPAAERMEPDMVPSFLSEPSFAPSAEAAPPAAEAGDEAPRRRRTRKPRATDEAVAVDA